MIGRDDVVLIYTDRLLSTPPLVPGNDPQLRYMKRFLPCGEEQHDAACGNGRYALNIAEKGCPNIAGIDLLPIIATKSASICAHKQAHLGIDQLANIGIETPNWPIGHPGIQQYETWTDDAKT